MKNTVSKLLLIDAGNTSLKWAVFDGGSLSDQQSYFYSEQAPIKYFSEVLKKQKDFCKRVIIVSVLGEDFNQKADTVALEYGLNILRIKSVKSLAGVTNGYDEPHKLGADRFVAMIGAYRLSNKQQQSKKACIIIDSGTATTIDAVDAQGEHLGGLILPGVDLCSRSLLKNTQQLSLWGTPTHENQKKLECNLFSRNTIDAIHSASILGLSGAIEQISLEMEKEIKAKNKYVQVDKYLCGGAAKLILSHLNTDYELKQGLIMLGLIDSARSLESETTK